MKKRKLFIEEIAKDPNKLKELKLTVAGKISEIIDISKLKEVTPGPHIEETPMRVAKMYVDELFKGCYSLPPKMKIFEENESTPVLSRNIIIKSTCSHHLVPFYGLASIYYVPDGKNVTGLSKFHRVCDYFARRPQVQERLTTQIGNYIWEQLNPKQLIVALKCKHMCISQRGVMAHSPITDTHWAKGDSEHPISFDIIQYVYSTIDTKEIM